MHNRTRNFIEKNVMRWVAVIVVILLLVSGCGRDKAVEITAEVKNTVKKVSEIYGEQNPEIMSLQEAVEESHHEDMYFVEVKGNFHKDDLHAAVLGFSMLANGEYVWCINGCDADEKVIWEGDSLEFENKSEE